MPFDRNGAAAGLQAIQDAIAMYMGLRQQRIGNERNASLDEMARQRLDLDRSDQDLRRRQIDLSELTNKQRLLGNVAGNYPGARITPERAGEYQAAGLGEAVAPEQTIRSRQFSQGIGMPGAGELTPAPTPPTSRPSAPQDTGMFKIVPTESEKYRTAYMNSIARANEGALNRTSREQMNQARIQARSEDMRLRNIIMSNAQALTKYGIDVRNEQNARTLAALIAYRGANLQEDQWEAVMRGGLASIIAMLGSESGGLPQAPDVNLPPYFTPPNANPGIVPGAGIGGVGSLNPYFSAPRLGDWEPF